MIGVRLSEQAAVSAGGSMFSSVPAQLGVRDVRISRLYLGGGPTAVPRQGGRWGARRAANWACQLGPGAGNPAGVCALTAGRQGGPAHISR